MAHTDRNGRGLTVVAIPATVQLTPEQAAVLLEAYFAGQYRGAVDELERTLADVDPIEVGPVLVARAELAEHDRAVDTLRGIATGEEPGSFTFDGHELRLVLNGDSEDVSRRLQDAFEGGDVGEARRLLGKYMLLVDVLEQLPPQEGTV
jgi:hypothetical protein